MKLGKNSYIGMGLIVVAIVLAIVVGYFRLVILQLQMTPDMAETCTMGENIPSEIVIGYLISFAIGVIGAYLIISDIRSARFKTQSAQDWSKKASSLGGDEKKLHDMIAQSDGVMFQSDIVEKSGMQKVKVSRVLDRLEARGLLERRRRGMSNVIMLKNRNV